MTQFVGLHEPAMPDDEAHRIARRLDLTVPGCSCRRCAGLRDIAILYRQPFGREDDEGLAAIDRINKRGAGR